MPADIILSPSYGAPSVSAILIAKLTFDVVCGVSFATEDFSPHDIIENNIWILPFWSPIYIGDKYNCWLLHQGS